jgi:hypothetical protein
MGARTIGRSRNGSDTDVSSCVVSMRLRYADPCAVSATDVAVDVDAAVYRDLGVTERCPAAGSNRRIGKTVHRQRGIS